MVNLLVEIFIMSRVSQGSMLRVIPSVVISAGFDKIDPYAKLGLIVGFMGSIKSEDNYTYETGVKSSMATNTEIYKLKKSGGVAFGFAGALGADFNLSEKLAIFGEFNLEGLSYAPTKGEVTEWTVNGADQLADAETFMKKFEYVKELNDDYDPSDTPGEATKLLKSKEPFSSIGINVGVKIKL